MRNSIDMVAALGGDGLINEVINAIAYTQIPLGIIPRGTTNAFAREKGIPLSIKGSINIFKDKNRSTIDLGLLNQKKYFLMMCSYGFDVKALSEISLMVKKKLKVFAYIWYGIRAFLLHNPVKVSVKVEQENKFYSGYYCIINNIKSYGNPLAKITPHASTDDGLLDICIFKNPDKYSFLKNTIGIFTSKHINYKDVVYIQTSNTVNIDIGENIENKPDNMQVQLDGDAFTYLPVSVTCARRALDIYLPGALKTNESGSSL
ncbi:MAG: YegS/Rv2252/BmrU family lipid kinase [Actinomycetota bacterium]|nr:YegS/Rv2252/BmrU family lipid kinase [Actinomycetota bacterium]